MAISYPLSLPTVKSAARISLSATTAVVISRSPSSYAQQVQKFSGQMWRAEVTLPAMAREDAEQFISFLLKLNGKEGTFLLGDLSAKTPRGTAGGTPLVNGANQTGQTLVTDGWSNSQTVLKAGDYIQIGQRLYKVLDDVTSDGSGNATFSIWPRLRESPSDNATIITSNCVGLFRLADSDYQILSASADKIYSVSFSAEEAI